MGMAANPDAHRDKPASQSSPRLHKHPPHAYVAKVVSHRALWAFVHANGTGDHVVAWVAAQQLGLITRPQLQAAGVARGAIASRLSRNTLFRVHRGVFLVGHPTPAPGAMELAALLACGDGAVVSHRSAAALWGLAAPPVNLVEITVAARSCKTHDRVRVHRAERLDPHDRRLCNGILATSPARTLIDFASDADPEEVERAIAEAHALGLVTEREILAAIERGPNRPGVALIRAVLNSEGGPRMTRSKAERILLALTRSARLPAPVANTVAAGVSVDFLWPEHRVVVEVDGYQFHGHRAAFERDHRKDLVLDAAGYHVIRITWRQLRYEPFVVVAHIACALDRRAPGTE